MAFNRPGTIRKLISAGPLWITAIVCGCGPASGYGPAAQVAQTRPAGNDAAARETRWTVLFDGTGTDCWRTLRGKAESSQGPMILDARSGPDVIVLATGLAMQDGEVEVELLRRPAERNDGPFTISLRLPARLLDWTGVYVVCRPGSVEVCKGSSGFQQPPPEMSARHDLTPLREIWRFVMSGGIIDCYRSGKKLLTYVDDRPRSGSICLTASKCRVEILAVRCRPAGQDGRTPQEKNR
ncbi:MAG: hypothetical protein HZA50_03130 [Planctomycetes bacterium]|nr:hypothetical protein [Planctomycetota bacterium]